MTRHLVLGNGNLLLCIDKSAQIRNFYYPYVGKEDHVRGHHHRIGVWVEGLFSWTSDDSWKSEILYKKESLVGDSIFVNKDLGISLRIIDAVHYSKNVYVKKIVVKNLVQKKRNVRLFLSQHFHIAGDNTGDTVYYDPIAKAIINYKGRRYFLTNGLHNKSSFGMYATGASGESEKKGTYIDAQDGVLSGNSIEHGSVDSIIGFSIDLDEDSQDILYYWNTVAKKFRDIVSLNEFVLKKGPERILKDTEDYWINWVNRKPFKFTGLDRSVVDLFKRSLLVIKTHTSENGAIIASADSDIMVHKRDNYSYMWPRDGALVSRSLDRAGYKELTKEFFQFCSDVSSDQGFLFHKYLPDKSLGSSWHPWLKFDKIQLPIQEDETALVLDALWKRCAQYGKDQFMKDMYSSFIKKAGDFMVSFRYTDTGLPKESYDLWEEKLGVHTFTACTVYAGLMAAHKLAKLFGTKKDSGKYKLAADEVKEAILQHLYDYDENRFIKGIYQDREGNWQKDKTIDVSTAYAVFEYNVLDVNDERVRKTMEITLQKLKPYQDEAGVTRYDGDLYFKPQENITSNPWFVSTLWVAEYYIAKAQNKADLDVVLDIFDWVVEHSSKSGILSEQIDPDSAEQLSVSPLTWSHAAFVIAVIKYLEKLDSLGLSKNNLS